MKPLVIIAHTPSSNTTALAGAATKGASDYAEGRKIITASPLDVETDLVMGAAGLIIGTTENIGAMAGLTKDMFDRCYNDWLGHTDGLPVAIYIRAGLDGTATNRQIQSIASALHWRMIQPPLILHGPWQEGFLSEAGELSAAMAAGLDAGIFG